MGLHSFSFFVFLLLSLLLYWSLFRKTAASQNLLLTATSIFFCGWADIRFLALLVFSIIFNFYTGRAIHSARAGRRRLLMYLGLTINIGLLIYYKYFNFFYDSLVSVFRLFEPVSTHSTLNIILPLGISFFTFQAIGYILDIYNEDIEPARELISFATFISYFPKMTAGPIERAGSFIPQVEKKREFRYHFAVDGLRQILWGSFVKLVIASNCASITGPIFDNYHQLPASTLLAGAFFYLFQVYCDFSGYSNIAIGISKLFGIQLMRNFAAPFFSTNIRDYWKKWHISLSSWMMHYVFTPISFSLRRYGKGGVIFSILLTFLIIGIWHGANWTFIVFGLLHGIYFIPLILSGNINRNIDSLSAKHLLSPSGIARMLGLFLLVMLTLIIFGAENISEAGGYLRTIFSPSLFTIPHFPGQTGFSRVLVALFFIIFLLGVEWVQRYREHEMQIDNIRSQALRIGIYYAVFIIIFLFGSIAQINFLYSQF